MTSMIRPTKAMNSMAALVGSLLLMAIAPAFAGAACPTSPTSRAFAQFGDNAAYSPVPGGTFESGTPGWSLSRSEVIAESVNPMGGSHALAINPGGQAVSAGFCVSSEYPSYRFLLRELKGGGKLYVALRWTDASGASRESAVATLEAGASWTPSPILELASNLPLSTAPEGTLNPVRLVFSTNHPGLAWAIDAVYIDPYTR
jgi:hypothetical protein